MTGFDLPKSLIEASAKICKEQSEEQAAVAAFVKSELEKLGAKSPAELTDDQRKALFKKVDDKFQSDAEGDTDKVVNESTEMTGQKGWYKHKDTNKYYEVVRFKNDDDANAFMTRFDGYGALASNKDYVYVAKKTDMGKSSPPSGAKLLEGIESNEVPPRFWQVEVVNGATADRGIYHVAAPCRTDAEAKALYTAKCSGHLFHPNMGGNQVAVDSCVEISEAEFNIQDEMPERDVNKPR